MSTPQIGLGCLLLTSSLPFSLPLLLFSQGNARLWLKEWGMSSSSPSPAGFNKQHLIIALAVGLSVVFLIIMCLLYVPIPSLYLFTSSKVLIYKLVSPSLSTTATANVAPYSPLAQNQRNPPANDVSANSTPSPRSVPSRNGGPEPRFPLFRRMMNVISLHGNRHNYQARWEGKCW